MADTSLNHFFNKQIPSVMHIDLNSCFASVEQQANPLYRGRPLAVAAYNSPGGCILAASIEAKRYGIKTGMRVKDGKILYPKLIVLLPDPNKYRYVHEQLKGLLSIYTSDFYPKSIDEFVLHFKNFPAMDTGLITVGQKIKQQIKEKIGDWLTVSIGIGPNRFLAKTASNLDKPDGLREINTGNYLHIYQNLSLTDLHGINVRFEARLRSVGINSVLEFYNADIHKLKAAFQSVLAEYWFSRLRGWEVDDADLARRTYGNSYALPRHNGKKQTLYPILQKLVEKTGFRMRRSGYRALGVHLGLLYRDGTYWHKGRIVRQDLFDSRDIYRNMIRLLSSCPYEKPVHTLSETCFSLIPIKTTQLNLFEDTIKKNSLIKSIDNINDRWGDFILYPAQIILASDAVQDRISFGGVREL